MRIKVFACDTVRPEIEAVADAVRNDSQDSIECDIYYVDKGLHSVGKVKMQNELQILLDGVDETAYDAVFLFYGLCSNGVEGLTARLPIILPKAHDCITFYMGSKERYRDYFDANPGTAFYTSGWNQDDFDERNAEEQRRKYVEQFGEDEADYLMEVLGSGMKYYRQLAFINTGTGNIEEYRTTARKICDERDWVFDEYEGDRRLFTLGLSGQWPHSDFLIVEPGQKIRPSYSNDVIKAE